LPLTPEERDELERLEHAFEAAAGRGVDLAEDIDALRRLRDLPHRPEAVRRRLVAEFRIYRAANARIALWALLHAALLARAADERATFIAVEETDQDHSGSLVGVDLLDADGVAVEVSETMLDDDLARDALICLDTSNRSTWGEFASDDETGRHVRLDIARILQAVVPERVFVSHPEVFPLAEGEELLEVGYSWGLTGTEDWGTGAWYFAVDRDVADADSALRAAVVDHLATPGANPDGLAFNWGDAVGEVPAETWARYGLRMLPVHGCRSVDVDHDETFVTAR
jgi:hypothetical protein